MGKGLPVVTEGGMQSWRPMGGLFLPGGGGANPGGRKRDIDKCNPNEKKETKRGKFPTEAQEKSK